MSNDVFASLCITREDFCTMVRQELESGITTEYSKDLAEAIANQVAADVDQAGDPCMWNTSDVRLGIGRVLLKALGVNV